MSSHKKNTTVNNTNYPIVGATPVEVNVHNKSNVDNPKIPVTRETATGTHVDHLDTIKKDHIIHKGDKQPTELHEPKAEKNYKLRDDDKEYEFKPRTEYTKTKDGKMKVWEEHGRKDHVIYDPTVHVHDPAVHVHDPAVHVHDPAVHVHEHGVHDHGVHDKDTKEGIKDKLKGTKEHVKDKIKEHKEHKEQKEHKGKLHGEHKVHEIKHEERVRPEYERTEHTKVEGALKPEYERTEFTRVEGNLKPEFEKTEHTRVEGKDHPYVTVGKGAVEIHEPREEKEYKMKDEDNIHVKFNINKT
jgi:hypothetical protein